ncbi:MAG: hypothetical protein WKF71_19190 [Pyrinomonadaceae bacterium]
MKKYVVVFSFAFICVSFNVNFGQSKRVTPIFDSTVQKINKRPPQTAPTPAPQPAETEDEPNTTNIERVETNTSNETSETDGEVITVDTELVSIPVKISDRQRQIYQRFNKGKFSGF